ncbi:DUF4139 domain-containing protein [Celeribacter marinus]|uniref:DUF4139 domain-containing protein n=1 Tax=Celeribacter marinus TaxID=1397108 RepID=UPI00317DFCB8
MALHPCISSAIAASIVALTPILAQADTFTAQSVVTSATLYPTGGEVVRRARLQMPAGRHELYLPNIPAQSAQSFAQSLRAELTNAQLGPIRVRPDPQTTKEDWATQEAEARKLVADAKATLDQLKRQKAAAMDEVTAAQDGLDFLTRLKAPSGTAAVDLAQIAAMIREQSALAREAMAQAQARSNAFNDSLSDAKAALDAAKIELARIADPDEARVTVSLSLDVPEDGDVSVDVVYPIQAAGWRPSYTARLDTVTGDMQFERSVQVTQSTGEAWFDVTLSLSTDRPERSTDPSYLSPLIRRVFDPDDMRPMARSMAADTMMLEGAQMKADSMVPRAYGLNLTYDLPLEQTVYSSADEATEFAMSVLEFGPQMSVRAVPLFDDTGYLMAAFQNTSGEMFLPGEVRLYRDGSFIGQTFSDSIGAGERAEFGFGPVDGIKVSRVIVDANEGDRGVIRKSNEMESAIRISVENLTDRVWPIEVMDRVSVSEQEDLDIEWASTQMPSEVASNDQRGILKWVFDLKANATWTTQLTERLTWPDGQQLQ